MSIDFDLSLEAFNAFCNRELLLGYQIRVFRAPDDYHDPSFLPHDINVYWTHWDIEAS
jgi:hypothetical protein